MDEPREVVDETFVDAHCVVCGSDPKWFMPPGATWPQGVIHAACRPIYEARQREAITDVTIHAKQDLPTRPA